MTSEKTTTSRAIVTIGILWVLLTAAGVLVSIYATPWLMPESASNTMHMGILTMIIFSVAAAPVAALVYAVVLYALAKWRYTGEGIPPDGPSLRANSPLTMVWIIGSTALTLFLLVWGLSLLASDNSGQGGANEMTVNVTGQQWLWSFQYPSTASTQNGTPVSVSNEDLYLPVNTPIKFNVTSKDVDHGFWIVQMGIKINAIPDTITTTEVTPNKLGDYDIRCTEICGLNHSYMTTKVHVLTEKAFSNWLAAQPKHF
jgi:cytochrome c oxidase subunit 2